MVRLRVKFFSRSARDSTAAGPVAQVRVHQGGRRRLLRVHRPLEPARPHSAVGAQRELLGERLNGMIGLSLNARKLCSTM